MVEDRGRHSLEKRRAGNMTVTLRPWKGKEMTIRMLVYSYRETCDQGWDLQVTGVCSVIQGSNTSDTRKY